MAPTISYTRENVYQYEALTKLLCLEELDVVREEVDSATNTIKLSCKHRWFVALCPDCGELTSVVSNYLRPRTVVDAPIRERHLRLLFDELQLLCPACGSTFVKPVSDVVPGADYTYRLLQEVVSLPKKEAQALVSRYGVTLEMAESLLKALKDKRHLESREPVSVKALGLAEVLDPHGRFDYGLVISDREQRRVLDVLPDQTKLDLIAWLNSPPAGVSLSELASASVTRHSLGHVILEFNPQAEIESSQKAAPSPPERQSRHIRSLPHKRGDSSTLWELEPEASHERSRPLKAPHASPLAASVSPTPIEGGQEEEDEPDRYQITVALLIALVTFVGALLAWRAAFAAGNATEADFASLYATLNVQQTESLNKAEVLRHSRAYMDYTRYNQEQALLEEADAPAELQGKRNEAINLATTNQFFFPQRYLERDGSYNAQRQAAEIWAQAAQNLDLEPEPHIAEAQVARQETKSLVAIFIPLSISLLFYTIAEALHPSQRQWRMAVAIAGTLFLIGTIGATIMVEFF